MKYFGLVVIIMVFWPCKYFSMNDEEVAKVRDQCHMIVNGVNNLLKKRISCKDNSLVESFQAKNIRDVENMGNTVEDLCNEKLRGEMIYIYEDGVEGFVEESGFNCMNEEGSEKNIAEGDKEVSSEENFE